MVLFLSLFVLDLNHLVGAMAWGLGGELGGLAAWRQFGGLVACSASRRFGGGSAAWRSAGGFSVAEAWRLGSLAVRRMEAWMHRCTQSWYEP